MPYRAYLDQPSNSVFLVALLACSLTGTAPSEYAPVCVFVHELSLSYSLSLSLRVCHLFLCVCVCVCNSQFIQNNLARVCSGLRTHSHTHTHMLTSLYRTMYVRVISMSPVS